MNLRIKTIATIEKGDFYAVVEGIDGTNISLGDLMTYGGLQANQVGNKLSISIQTSKKHFKKVYDVDSNERLQEWVKYFNQHKGYFVSTQKDGETMLTYTSNFIVEGVKFFFLEGNVTYLTKEMKSSSGIYGIPNRNFSGVFLTNKNFLEAFLPKFFWSRKEDGYFEDNITWFLDVFPEYTDLEKSDQLVERILGSISFEGRKVNAEICYEQILFLKTKFSKSKYYEQIVKLCDLSYKMKLEQIEQNKQLYAQGFSAIINIIRENVANNIQNWSEISESEKKEKLDGLVEGIKKRLNTKYTERSWLRQECPCEEQYIKAFKSQGFLIFKSEEDLIFEKNQGNKNKWYWTTTGHGESKPVFDNLDDAIRDFCNTILMKE